MTPRFLFWCHQNRRTLRPVARFLGVLAFGIALGYGVTEGFMPDERYVVEVRR